MIVVGLNAYHADSAACLVKDGRLIAAAEEERFRRVKHWAGFPAEALRWCLAEAGATARDIDLVAVNRDPKANLLRKALFAFARRPSLRAVRARLGNAAKVASIEAALAAALSAPEDLFAGKVRRVEHHRAHLASAFHVSPFPAAAVASVDGFGDFVSAMWGRAEGHALDIQGQVFFPHSLGLFYLAATQYLGFPNYGDEYKVMGLAAYGRPAFAAELGKILRLEAGGGFSLGLDYFRHHSEGVEMVWDDGEPRVGSVFTPAWAELLGPARAPGDPIEARHKDLAASLQAAYEAAFFHLLAHLAATTGERRLALAGGCAMNSLANGRIAARSPFAEVYIPPAAGDAGGAIGAALVALAEAGGERPAPMTSAALGPGHDREALAAALAASGPALREAGCEIREVADTAALLAETAARIAGGQVVGWFQGRMEWGPRALGARSILGDPRRADMKDILNLKIKRRESFRPFAPSILRERVGDWFETDTDVPFMGQVLVIRPERRALVPAVTHVDGTGRLQTVARDADPLYHGLIAAFDALTGVPMVLNTSFNENEPIICRPHEALDCFLRTRMDTLVLGPFIVSR